MKINYNMSAIIANDKLAKTDTALSTSIEKLSSGYKINHAKDSPSGIAIAKKMHDQIRGLNRAAQNASDGISVIETAEGTLSEVQDMLQRMNELAIKGSTGTLSDSDRQTLQDEVDQLRDEIDRIAGSTEFNGNVLLDGTFDLKGYTSNPDVKVESYSDQAKIGNYYIEGITVKEIEKVDADGNPIDENGLPVYEQKLDENGEPVLDANGKPVMNQISEPVMIKTLDTTNVIFKPVDGSGNPVQITLPSGKQVDALDIVNPKCIVAEDGYTLTVTGDNQFSMTLTFDISDKDAVPPNNTIDPANIELTGIGAMTMQIGANEGQTLDIRIPTVSSKTLGIHQVDVTKKEDARLSINRISNALDTISSIRSRLGAYQNRLESSVSSLDVTEENMTSAYSRIMDVNMAEEMTEYTKNQVLVQAGTSMLAQANERPSQVLQLLQ